MPYPMYVLVGTERDTLRQRLTRHLARAGHAVRTVSDWPGLLRAAVAPGARLVLVDGHLTGLDAELLTRVVASLPDGPTLRSVGGTAPPLKPAGERPDHVLRAAGRHVRSLVPRSELRELRLVGLGPDVLPRLAELAAQPTPICIAGERGTGKVRVARVLHRLSAAPGPFVESSQPELGGPPGTVYLDALERLEPAALEALEARVATAGWRLVGGTRARDREVRAPTHWARLALAPLRERPDELRDLTALYLDRHRRQLGLPRRRFNGAMWSVVLGHPWHGNARELETFVAQVVRTSERPTVSPEGLPAPVRALLEPQDETDARLAAQSFEDLVESRLRPLVQRAGPGVPLWHMTHDATSRALLRLALARTGGNQKAAAELLGIARNTLIARARALGVLDPR